MKTLFIIILIISLFFIFNSTNSFQNDKNSKTSKEENNELFKDDLLDDYNVLSTNSINNLQFQKEKESLHKKFDSILKKYNLKSTKYSLSVYSLNQKEFIFEENPELFLKPASVTKLLTTYSIFSLVSDTFNFRTNLYTEDENLSDGVINGNLFIRGSGNPNITLSNLDILVQNLKNLRIRKIEGKIITDGNLFEDKKNRFQYSGDADEVEPVAPITGLSLEKNRIKVLVNTYVNNDIPKIQIIPNSSNFIISNNLTILPSSNVKKKKDSKSSKSVRFSVHSKLNESGNQIIFLNGKLKKNSSYGVEDFNLNPELTFASVFKNRLISNGISVSGNFETLKKNKKINYSNLNFVTSVNEPLTKILTEMNKNSDNYMAENLFMLIGSIAEKDSITSVSAKKLYDSLIHELSKNNKEMQNKLDLFKINDGSGLSRRNKVSSEIICDILIKISQSSYFKSFLQSLPIAGIDGTLAKRMKGTNAAMNLIAKTGTHNDVSALAGFVRNQDGNIYAFAFLFNGGSVGTYKMIENELGIVLSNMSNKDFSF